MDTVTLLVLRGGMLLRASDMVLKSPEPSCLTVMIALLLSATFTLVFKMVFLFSYFFTFRDTHLSKFPASCVYELEVMFSDERRNRNRIMSWEWVLETMARQMLTSVTEISRPGRILYFLFIPLRGVSSV